MKKAGIVSIGNELLNGQTTDTNASWLAGELWGMGIVTAGVWTVPDEVSRIVQALKTAAEQTDILLVTGGLGPTDDDVTRQAMAAWLGVELEFQPDWLEKLKAFFEDRGRKMAPRNRTQAYCPAGCERLDNSVGTAPGFCGIADGVFWAVMPGVPAEMTQMFNEHVMGRIRGLAEGGPVVVSGKLRCFGASESDIAQQMGDLMRRGRNPLINCTCGSGEIVLHIVATAADKTEGMKMLQDDKHMLRELLGDVIFGEDDSGLSLVVGQLLRQHKKTIVIAESCTGGLLSKILTDVPGSSEYMLAGWVTYSNEAKISQLGVYEQLIRDFGAVSEPVARAMAQGAAQKSGADVAVSVTGIAGPGGAAGGKPVGLVYIGVLIDGVCDVKECRFGAASRESIRMRATLTALNQVRLRLQI
ncbi:MAG: competence/damage-inducible protein A [Planctomycetales bacterium]|nr:competence/damage-inducible protein A [Planctomycetales bacterium]